MKYQFLSFFISFPIFHRMQHRLNQFSKKIGFFSVYQNLTASSYKQNTVTEQLIVLLYLFDVFPFLLPVWPLK